MQIAAVSGMKALLFQKNFMRCLGVSFWLEAHHNNATLRHAITWRGSDSHAGHSPCGGAHLVKWC